MLDTEGAWGIILILLSPFRWSSCRAGAPERVAYSRPLVRSLVLTCIAWALEAGLGLSLGAPRAEAGGCHGTPRAAVSLVFRWDDPVLPGSPIQPGERPGQVAPQPCEGETPGSPDRPQTVVSGSALETVIAPLEAGEDSRVQPPGSERLSDPVDGDRQERPPRA